MDELEFYMDVSPEWWIKSRKNESFVKKYIYEKFDYDFYPRIISKGTQKIDLDEEINFKSMLIDKLKNRKFVYEFLPEDESIKENYSIWNGNVSNQHSKKLTNSRLMINF